MAQEAYVRAFGSLGQFRGDSSLATWLTRNNEALGRLRRHRPMVDLAVLDAQPSGKSQVIPVPLMTPDIDPERAAAHRQIRHLIAQAINGLPEILQIMFVMRDVERISIEEAAGFRDLQPTTRRRVCTGHDVCCAMPCTKSSCPR